MLATENAYLEYETLKIDRLDKVVKRTVYPQAAKPAYQGAFTGYSEIPVGDWFDCAYPAIEFYGLKYAFDGSQLGGAGANVLGVCKTYFNFFLEFKNVC